LENVMAADSKVAEVTDRTFSEDVESGDGLAIVDFWAVWCQPCKLVAPMVEELAEQYEDRGLRVRKLDVDSNPRVASRFAVRSIPSVLFFKDGELVDRVVGAVPKPQLEEKVLQHLG
jgi:thioredoxin 1